MSFGLARNIDGCLYGAVFIKGFDMAERNPGTRELRKILSVLRGVPKSFAWRFLLSGPGVEGSPPSHARALTELGVAVVSRRCTFQDAVVPSTVSSRNEDAVA